MLTSEPLAASISVTLLGDGAYNVVELGLRCQKLRVTLIAMRSFC
ncbi:MAG: hypothetical protein ACKVZH_01050 [Blastocatellia bacterium]